MHRTLSAGLLILMLAPTLLAQREFAPETLLKPKFTGPYSIPVNLDARTSYDRLGERAGINMVFTPSFEPEVPVALRVEGDTFLEALNRLSEQTGNFWFAWDSKTIVVAPETPSAHRDFEPQIYKTFYLDSVTSEVAANISNTLRTRQIRDVYSAQQNKAIIVAGSAANVDAAERLISEMSGQGLPLSAGAPLRFPRYNRDSVSIAEAGRVRRVVSSTAAHMENMLVGSVSIDMNRPARAIYEDLAARVAMNVIFARSLDERPVSRFHVEGVDLVNALDLLALQTGTLWQPLNESTIFVMQDTAQNRRDYQRMVVKVIYLPATTTTAGLNETINVLRTSLVLRTIFQNEKHKAIVIRDTAPQVFLVEKIIADLNRRNGKPTTVALTTETSSFLTENGWILGNAARARPELELKLRSKTNIRLNEKPRAAFESVAGLAGLDIVFDSRVANDAETAFSAFNVDILDALDLLAWQTRHFWQVVDAHTIRVIPDTQAVRRDLEPMIEKTMVPADPVGANELLNVLRTVFSLRQIRLDEKNAIVIRDTADNVALSERLVEILGGAGTNP